VQSALQWVLETGTGVYDAYKGYKQQEWENQNTEQQQAAQYMALGYQAAEAGQTDLANQYGTLAGLGDNYFDSYTPTTTAMSYSDIADALSSAASMKAYGANDASAAILQAAGLDSSLLNGYNPLALTTSTSSGSSSSSSLSTSDLTKLYSTISSLAEDGQYSLAQQLGSMWGIDTSGLADTYSSKTSSTGSTLSLSDLTSLASAYDDTPSSNPAKSVMAQMLEDYSTQYSAAQTQAETDAQITSLTQKYAAMGYTDEQIYYRLKHLGLTD
jgi:hypothetical protein